MTYVDNSYMTLQHRDNAVGTQTLGTCKYTDMQQAREVIFDRIHYNPTGGQFSHRVVRVYGAGTHEMHVRPLTEWIES